MDFCIFFGRYWGGVKSDKFEKYFDKNWGRIWSYRALVKAILRQNFALYHLGMVPGDEVLKGEGKPWIFVTFLGGYQMGKNMKMQDEHGQISISRALDPRKMIS